MKATSSGVWKLTVTNGDPEDKKLEGTYQAYYNDCDHNQFIGFYKLGYLEMGCVALKILIQFLGLLKK